jgi:hypothetical protein
MACNKLERRIARALAGITHRSPEDGEPIENPETYRSVGRRLQPLG